MTNDYLIEQARICHGEHTTHGKFIQSLANRVEELDNIINDVYEMLGDGYKDHEVAHYIGKQMELLEIKE